MKFKDALGIFRIRDADLEIEPKHSMEKVAAIEATCVQDGSREYYECENCGRRFANKTGDGTELSENDIMIRKKAHDLQPITGGNDRYYRCSMCNGYFDEDGNELTSIPPIDHTETSSYRKHSSSGGSSAGRTSFSGTAHSTGGPGVLLGTSDTPTKSATGTAPLAQAGSWQKDDRGWQYNFINGGRAIGTQMSDAGGNITERVNWLKINGKDFAFGADGYMKVGWLRDSADSKWYFCDENNGKVGGWYQSANDKKWYYLDPITGVMMTGWQLINGKQYYFATVYTPSTEVGATAYPEGAMYAGGKTPDGSMVDASGARIN